MDNGAMIQDRDQDHLASRIASLRAELASMDPCVFASHTGAEYTSTGTKKGEFRLSMWDRPVVLTFPDFGGHDEPSGRELSSMMQALLLYYFRLSDGTPLANHWIAFSELPDGRFYNQAFQGYSGKVIAREFGNDLEAFRRNASKIGGQEHAQDQALGDAAYVFQVLPHVALLAVYWCGDEDFPASCQILFDASVSHHLSTDACAILGSTLTHRLVKGYGEASR
jgi:hypothetical protein